MYIVKDQLIRNPRVTQIRCTDGLILPLHLLFIYGFVDYYDDGIDKLLEGLSSSLSICDAKYYNMYPFLLAACTPMNEDKTKNEQHLETIYMTLLSAPWVMDNLCRSMLSRQT